MIDHIGVRVSDIAASARFYDAIFDVLGHVRTYTDPDLIGYGATDRSFLWLHRADNAGPAVHVALLAPDHDTVIAFHAVGIRAGGQDNGAPGLRTDYSPSYFAAFLLDPDGNNIEAVCTGEVA